ncbi:hypothetical protein SLITO_v1c10230 [Spiroplasma litorale]|uniref:Uncharacterized protein n=1 Tax=Spiroplasma litorale TaxID=216942 RepID=A0A0K1W2T3_9MOLU|nr:hypothetical protein [Spiroplasma litorale]AKX34634.1 hypothetical protein SLITO_v1c10230 [Spiroplasma litorale]
MKKYIALIGVFAITSNVTSFFVTETKYTNLSEYNYFQKYKSTSINNVNYKELTTINKDKYQRSITSRYPKSVGKSDKWEDNLDYFKEVSQSDRNNWFGLQNIKVSEFNIQKDLGYENKEDFMKDYSNIELVYNYGYNFTNNGNKGWQKSELGVNMGTPENGNTKISLSNDRMEVVVKEDEFKHTSSSKHKIKMTIKGEWISSYNYQLSFSSISSLDYNKGSNYAHAAYTGFYFTNVFIN